MKWVVRVNAKDDRAAEDVLDDVENIEHVAKDSGERTTHVDCLRSETGSVKVNEYAIEAISFVFGANALSIKLVAIVWSSSEAKVYGDLRQLDEGELSHFHLTRKDDKDVKDAVITVETKESCRRTGRT